MATIEKYLKRLHSHSSGWHVVKEEQNNPRTEEDYSIEDLNKELFQIHDIHWRLKSTMFPKTAGLSSLGSSGSTVVARLGRGAFAEISEPWFRASNTRLTKYVTYGTLESEFEETQILSQVLEVHPEFIIVNSLVDAEKKVFQKRKIENTPIRDLYLIPGDILKITIRSRPLEKRFIYSKGEASSSILFKKEVKGIFKDVIDSSFFKKR